MQIVRTATPVCIVEVMRMKRTRKTERQHVAGERRILVMDWFRTIPLHGQIYRGFAENRKWNERSSVGIPFEPGEQVPGKARVGKKGKRREGPGLVF